MKVELVMRGSFSIKSYHMKLIRSSARCGWPARMCTCSSKDEMKGDTVAPASGAGAPYLPQRAARPEEMEVVCEVLATSPERTAQQLPSCGWRVVVSLSR